jgi:hypothetical protein
MRRALLAVAIFAAPVLADDASARADLDKAKAAHTKEMLRLRDKLLADIDAVIRSEYDRGAGINYLLKERKGFEENGVVPILPKLLPASREYVDGQKAANAALEKAYTTAILASVRAGNTDQEKRLRAELKEFQGNARQPQAPAKEPGKEPPVKVQLKDAEIEKQIVQSKTDYATAIKAATAAMIDAFKQAKTKILNAKAIADEQKLKQLDLLAKEQQDFETKAIRPKSAEMRAALKEHDEAISRARFAFGKAMDKAAKAYLDQGDVPNFSATLKRKQRGLDHPNGIDLIALVDLKLDVMRGEFQLKDGVLTIPGSGNALVQLPYEPGPEYDLHMTVERLDGDDLIAVGLIASGNQFYAIFDGWAAAGYRSGIQYIDGKLCLHNGTVKVGQCVPQHKPVELDVSVRKDSIRVWAKGPGEKDRRPVVDYIGPQDRLGIPDELGIKNKKAFFLLTLGSKVAISDYELVPVGLEVGKPAR